MKYRLVISDAVFEKIKRQLHYLDVRTEDPKIATKWCLKLFDRLDVLRQFPHHCSPAPENEWSSYELHAFVVNEWLFIYHVDDSSQTIYVTDFRRGSQDTPKRPDP